MRLVAASFRRSQTAATSREVRAGTRGWFLLGKSSVMQAEASAYQPVNHVFVDFENVKEVDKSVLGRTNYIVHLFLGPQNKKLDVDVVERLLEHSQAVKMIRSPKSGKNALDFVMAYHLGQAVQSDPRAFFHLVSGDVGFESLVELLKARKVKVKRHSSWEELDVAVAPATGAISAPVTGPSDGSKAGNRATKAPANGGQMNAAPLSSDAAKVLKGVKNMKAPPKKKAGLVNKAKELLGKGESDSKVAKVVEELRKARHLKIDDKGAVSYC